MSRFRIELTLEGLPPKKDGANSMWNKPGEIQKLITLRRAALTAMAGRAPFSADIRLELDIYATANRGDLDNFITGVCDGLQAAAMRTPVGLGWEASELASIHPTVAVAILNDAAVEEIRATRHARLGAPSYRLVVEGPA